MFVFFIVCTTRANNRVPIYKTWLRQSDRPLFVSNGILTLISKDILETVCLIYKISMDAQEPTHYLTW